MQRTDANWQLVVITILEHRAFGAPLEIASVLRELFTKWPTPEAMCRATEVEVYWCLHPLGLHRKRARQLIRLSSKWLGPWTSISELVPSIIVSKLGVLQ